MERIPPRLILVTPRQFDLEAFAPRFAETLDAADIAAVILDLDSEDEADWRRATEVLCPISQQSGAAFLLHNRAELARELKTDGAHVTGDSDALKQAMGLLTPEKIVGAGDCTTRHAAMMRGEASPDYVLLGRLDPEGDVSATFNLVEWWCDLFQLPCVALCADDWKTVEDAVDGGAEFAALRDLVWTHRDGAAAAVKKASAIAERLQVKAA